ncbi:hypothetical protein HYW54_05000 [Candidatus Gottesmanbacteria bacterium]|nr:hypothetical protein [Candidatus Gottesmanbacteria bacterium]
MVKKATKDIKIYLDPIGNTMNIWWGDPGRAYSSEEVDDPKRNDVIVKDKKGRPLSLEIIGVFPEELNVSSILKKSLERDYREPFLLKA